MPEAGGSRGSPGRDEALRAMSAGDFQLAARLWQDGLNQSTGDVSAWLNLAACQRATGNLDGAFIAVDGALGQDPRDFMALLMRASLLERAGRHRDAGPAYGTALLQAPPEHALDAATRRAVAHAREVNTAYSEELSDVLKSHIGGRGGESESRRVNVFVDFVLGRRKNYRQEPVGYFYPGLPAIEFWDRHEFPWLHELESQTETIHQELLNVLGKADTDFAPYIDYSDSIPLDQWKQLNRSPRWGAFHLREHGAPIAKNIARCPKTYELLQSLPQPIVPNRSPAAMFSALAPHTHIPPHTGVANTRLVVHLPLIVPDGCRFRVGNETRSYTDGEAWVFDDTIEHEAWNDSNEPRIILLFDVWNPRLSQWEQEMIAEISGALDEFNGAATSVSSPQL